MPNHVHGIIIINKEFKNGKTQYVAFLSDYLTYIKNNALKHAKILNLEFAW